MSDLILVRNRVVDHDRTLSFERALTSVVIDKWVINYMVVVPLQH